MNPQEETNDEKDIDTQEDTSAQTQSILHQSNKVIIIGVSVAVVAVIAIFLFIILKPIPAAEIESPAAEVSTESDKSESITVDSGEVEEVEIEVADVIDEAISNPVESIPDINPADKTNPFANTYKNPFE